MRTGRIVRTILGRVKQSAALRGSLDFPEIDERIREPTHAEFDSQPQLQRDGSPALAKHELAQAFL
jgi:hypothetical protein